MYENVNSSSEGTRTAPDTPAHLLIFETDVGGLCGVHVHVII